MGYNLNKVTRIEIIDRDGRSYVNKSFSEIELQFQDDGQTLKVFLTE
jgi:hypothetical protein